MSEPRRVLYRCGTPTNWLCPCGAVARRLKKHGLEYRTERVRRRRSQRPEIVELTRGPQRIMARMPTLDEQQELDMAETTPVLVVVDSDGNGMVYAADRFVLLSP